MGLGHNPEPGFQKNKKNKIECRTTNVEQGVKKHFPSSQLQIQYKKSKKYQIAIRPRIFNLYFWKPDSEGLFDIRCSTFVVRHSNLFLFYFYFIFILFFLETGLWLHWR